MPAFARQFEPHVTRSGTMSKFRFSVRCSSCARSETYEATKPVGDDLVKGFFRERGWLLGRDRAYDLCPSCLAKPTDATQPRKRLGIARSGSVTAMGASDRRTETISARDQETADILARHLGKPEALAAEVFRPKEQHVAGSTLATEQRQPAHSVHVAPELTQILANLASDFKGLKEVMEDISVELRKLTQVGSQQREAIEGLGSHLQHSAKQVLEGLNRFAQTVPQAQPMSHHFSEPSGAESPLQTEKAPNQASIPAEDPAPKPHSQKQGLRRKRSTVVSRPINDAAASTEAIVVKSFPDVNNAHRFYTSIRLPRDLWDASGFEPTNRLLIDWDGQSLTVNRVTEGGVKPKSVGKAQVVLQSWKLGNLNLNRPSLDRLDTGIRLVPKV